MNFLNQPLAWGAAALAIPLAIHLLNRSRFKTVEWGAMHLLADVVKNNRRRFRLDQLLLLLVRCAIPVLLAFCLAQPVWTGGGDTKGDGPVSLALVLDDSRSMGLPGEGGTRFEEAVDAAKELIAGAGRGSDFVVILAGSPPSSLTDAPTFDADALRAALDRLADDSGTNDVGPQADPADLPAALDVARTALAEMSHADREIVVLSDWPTGALPTDAADAFRRSVADLPAPPSLTLLPIRGQNEEVDNVSVEALETPARLIGVGRPIRLRATLRNHGAAERTVRATLTVDGTEAGVQSVVVPAGGTVGALFVQRFEEPGTHAVAVSINANDDLPADDIGRLAVRALGRLPVLLVDGAPSRKPLRGETDFLSVALTPLTFGKTAGFAGDDDSPPADLIETRTLLPKELSFETLAGARLAVLANVDRLSDDGLSALEQFVETGGALLIAAGDRVDLNWHRERLHADGNGLLPRPWTGVAGADDAASRVLAERFDHPALEPFNRPPGAPGSGGDLTAADVRRWMIVETGEQNAGSPRGRVIARLDTADPLLIVDSYGAGTVVQMTTAVDADWSDLPLRPSFVPLMQGLAATLAARPAPPANLRPGEAAVALAPVGVDAGTALAPDGRRVPVAVVERTSTDGDSDPSGAREAASERIARFENTRLPGFYEFRWPSSDQAENGPTRFAVAADPRESAFSPMTAEQQRALAERLGATIVGSAQEYRDRDDRRRYGRELWKWMLGGLLAALFVELLLQQRISRPRWASDGQVGSGAAMGGAG